MKAILFFIPVFCFAAEIKYPYKICPAAESRKWNVTEILNKRDMKILCDKRMLRPLREFLVQGAECRLFDEYILCGKQPSEFKICIGIPGIHEWTVDYKVKNECIRTPRRSLFDYVPKEYKCMIRNQGILCLPDKFVLDEVFPDTILSASTPVLIKRDKLDDLKCPPDVESIADFNKIYCIHKDKVTSCEKRAFKDKYFGQDVCKLIDRYFHHIWYLEKSE